MSLTTRSDKPEEKMVFTMDLEPRLKILKENNVLSEENYERTLNIIRHFNDEYDIKLIEENASAFITHLCIALERASRSEPVQAIDPETYEEVTLHPAYEQVCKISDSIREMHPFIPESEIGYLNLHLTAMIENIQS